MEEEHLFHPIKARLYRNKMNGERKDYYAKADANRTLSVDEVCLSAAGRGGADIDAPAMAHAVELYHRELEYLLCDGFAINTGLYIVRAAIKGVFHGPRDEFDPERHRLSFRFTPGARLRRTAATATVEMQGAARGGTQIARVVDLKTGAIDSALTPGHNLKITGNKLKIVGTHPDVGIYFVDYDTGERTKVEAPDIITNHPQTLMVIIPPLKAGDYELEVVTQFTGATYLLKEPSTVYFGHVLVV